MWCNPVITNGAYNDPNNNAPKYFNPGVLNKNPKNPVNNSPNVLANGPINNIVKNPVTTNVMNGTQTNFNTSDVLLLKNYST